jgi:hypothetical protein
MVLANYDAIIAALTNGLQEVTPFQKASQTTDAAGAPCLSWRAVGNPSAGAVPATGAGTIPTKDTAGAIFMANPTANLYLTKFGMGGATQNIAWLIDILWFNSGLNGTTTTAQTFTSTALTRYSGTAAAGNEIALICWTATGSTATTITATYTNQAGTAAKVTPAVNFWTGGLGGGTVPPTADQFQVLPFASGDTGVRALADVDLLASTLTAGDFGACIFRRLAMVGFNANQYVERDLVLQTTSLPERFDDACLALVIIPSTTSTGNYFGVVEAVEG